MKGNNRLALVICMTLLLNAALPFFGLGKLPDMQSNAYDLLYGNKMVICTSDGFVIADTADVFDGKHGQKQHCQSCYFNAAASPAPVIAPHVAAVVYGGVISKSLAGFGGQQLQNQLYLTSLTSRAPPLFA